MNRPYRTTTQKGLGHRHRLQREKLLRQHVDGSGCELCGEPMFKKTQLLQADHVVPRAIAGPRALATRLVHSECNAKAGAILGAALNGKLVTQPSKPDRNNLAFPWP